MTVLRSMRRQSGRDAGAGTLLMAGVIGFAGLLVCVTLALGQAVITRHRAGAAADLAALAAAAILTEGAAGTSACAQAEVVARLNAGTLVACAVEPGGDVTVRVRIGIANALLSGLPPATVASRAGPARGA